MDKVRIIRNKFPILRGFCRCVNALRALFSLRVIHRCLHIDKIPKKEEIHSYYETRITYNLMSCLSAQCNKAEVNPVNAVKNGDDSEEEMPILSLIAGETNLSSVHDADQEIPTRGQTDNAGNEVYPVSGIIR